MQHGAHDPAQTADLMERMLYEVKRVVVGQDRFLERVFVGIGFAVPIENAAAGAGMPPF